MFIVIMLWVASIDGHLSSLVACHCTDLYLFNLFVHLYNKLSLSPVGINIRVTKTKAQWEFLSSSQFSQQSVLHFIYMQKRNFPHFTFLTFFPEFFVKQKNDTQIGYTINAFQQKHLKTTAIHTSLFCLAYACSDCFI